MKIIRNYQNNETLRKSFNDLSKQIFDIDFEEWYQRKMWGDRYEPIGLEVDGKIVANVSVNKLAFVVNGIEKKALQIGTVMVNENYRNLGYGKMLMKKVIETFQEEYGIIYLFSNKEALNFYGKLGFTRVPVTELSTEAGIEQNIDYEFRKLNVEDKRDEKIIRPLGEIRVRNSEKFDVLYNRDIFYFYCIGMFKDSLYYNAKENIIVIYTMSNTSLIIHDIVSDRKVDYYRVIGSIIKRGIENIIFNFNLDIEGVVLNRAVVDDDSNALFILGDTCKEVEIIYPITALA